MTLGTMTRVAVVGLAAALLAAGCTTRKNLAEKTTASLRVPRGAAVRVTYREHSANDPKVQFINASTNTPLGEVSGANPQLIIPPDPSKRAYRLDLVPLVRDADQPKDTAPWVPGYIKLASTQGNKYIYGIEDGFDNSNLRAPVANATEQQMNWHDGVVTVELIRSGEPAPETQPSDLP